MGAVVFCNIAWMNRYKGITDTDQPRNGGSWVKENNDAMESLNFAAYNNVCYGYVEHRGSDLNLERLDKTAIKADVLDDVTVVWVATSEEGSRIVGWYENAQMYRHMQEFDDGSCYYFSASADNAYRIPVTKRTFPVPRATHEGKGRGMGQSNVWYADADFAKRVYIPKVMTYLDGIRNVCRITGFTLEERRKIADIPYEKLEDLLSMAAAASDDGDILQAVQISNQILHEDKNAGGFIRVFRGLGLEDMLCYDDAIEAYKDALVHFTDDEKERFLDVDAKEKLSRLYRMTGKNFMAWHMEEEIYAAYREDKDNAGMVGSLLEMMSIASEEKDFGRLEKLIATFDDIGTKYCADDVEYYRDMLKQKG